MTSYLRPLGDMVLVKVIEESNAFAGGQLLLPETAKERPQRGEVLAIGPGQANDKGIRTPPDVQIGDNIIYAKYTGTELKMDGDWLLLVHEEDILAVYQD